MLGWEAPDSDVFRRVLAHPMLVPYYHAMMGEGYRMDHLPLLIQQAPGADGFVFHGGKMNDDGTWCEELAYQWHGGKMHNRLLAVSVAMTETKEGDGGFCIIPGSQEQHALPPFGPAIRGAPGVGIESSTAPRRRGILHRGCHPRHPSLVNPEP